MLQIHLTLQGNVVVSDLDLCGRTVTFTADGESVTLALAVLQKAVDAFRIEEEKYGLGRDTPARRSKEL